MAQRSGKIGDGKPAWPTPEQTGRKWEHRPWKCLFRLPNSPFRLHRRWTVLKCKQKG